ncbi:peptidase M15 [Bradyrhizobium sp. TZ2]
MMNPQRFAQVTSALCGTAVLAGWVIASFGSASIENATGAMPIEDRRAPSLTAGAEPADAPHAAAMGNADVANADVATAAEAVTKTAAEPVMETATDTTAKPTSMTLASVEPTSIVEAASPVASKLLPPQMPLPETPPVQVATANTSDPLPIEVKEPAVRSIEILEECLVVDVCIDQYLWALYQRTPKQDTMKVQERRKVTVQMTVKKKRKMVTVTKIVTKTFTKLVPQDFTWKDPHAAEKAGMPMMDYVIGGMDRSFKLKLFHTLHAAEQAGLSPGITSAFRDDYRQSIASGLKAASDRSYHGGSFRGGYGHGLAADVVSVKGATKAERWISTENLWKWIDAHGKDFGIGRPYLDRDPPHVAPIDGKEYASRRGPNAQHAEASAKKRNRLAARADHSGKRTIPAHRRKAEMVVARAQARR